MGNGKAAAATTSKRPWSIYYDNSIIDESSYAFKVAKDMVNTYANSEFEHSARLRQIISQSGQQWLNERCSKMLAYKLWFIDRPTEDMSIEERQALEAYQNQRHPSTVTLSNGSTKSDPHVSPPKSSSSAPSTSSSSSTESSDSEGSSEGIINFRPSNQKPTFRFEPSSIAAGLPGFLAAMKASNEELISGKVNKNMELSDDDSGEGEHIEMDLSLGVLEEVKCGGSPILPTTKHQNPPALAAPTTTMLKRKPASEESSISKKIKPQTSNKASNDQIFSASPFPALMAPITPKKALLRLIHNPKFDDFRPVRTIKMTNHAKEAQNSSSDDSSSEVSSSDNMTSHNDSSESLLKSKASKSKLAKNKITKIKARNLKSPLVAAKANARQVMNIKENSSKNRIIVNLNIFIKRADHCLTQLPKQGPSKKLTNEQSFHNSKSEKSIDMVPRLPLTDPVQDTISVHTQPHIDGLANVDYTDLESVLDFSQMVHINAPEFIDFMSDAKVHNWISDVDSKQLELFPDYMEPSEEELLAFEGDILSTLQTGALEGYNVVR
ncbi:hypothetical protein BGZ60DRAFT_45007 [Tricladium varicosporioides]|nr:hypothetical protein BGZ60DRAFT_45007 [Hymenoscyphus varicosporioides]